MFYITFDCYHLNQARTRALSVLPGPGPALGEGRAVAQGSGPGPCRPVGGIAPCIKTLLGANGGECSTQCSDLHHTREKSPPYLPDSSKCATLSHSRRDTELPSWESYSTRPVSSLLHFFHKQTDVMQSHVLCSESASSDTFSTQKYNHCIRCSSLINMVIGAAILTTLAVRDWTVKVKHMTTTTGRSSSGANCEKKVTLCGTFDLPS
jgi:hypothetical protein